MQYGKAIQAVISTDHKNGVHHNAYIYAKVCPQCREQTNQLMYDTPEWETCIKCGDEFKTGHICREHGLCGICHPPMPTVSPSDNYNAGPFPLYT